MPGKVRLAIFMNDLVSAGGIQRVAMNLARDLSYFADVTIVTVEPLPPNVPFFEKGIELKSLNYSRGATNRWALLREMYAIRTKLKACAIESKFEAVLAIWYDMATIAAYGLPRGVVKIGCEHISYDEAVPRWKQLRARAYRKLDAVVSLTARDQVLYSAINRRAVTIPNAVPLAREVPFAQRQKILFTAGHLIPRKGIDRLLWALKKPLKDHPDWKLVVVGGGELGHVDLKFMNYVSGLLHTLDLEKHVEFHPATRKINDWYLKSSVYVMGSRQEGLPMVLLEAKAHGLPIVSFDCPTGPREIVRNGVDGYLINDDSEAFGEAVARLMDDPVLAERMSVAARQDVARRYGISTISEQWRALIQNLIGREIGQEETPTLRGLIPQEM